jgi:xanthine dehydrogenase accessory factor
MKSLLLNRLNHARTNRQAVVLVTCLSTGEQALLSADEKITGFEPNDKIKAYALSAIATDQCLLISDAGKDLFIQPYNPPLRMIITGAVHITKPLTSMAGMCGYQVIIIDPRQAFANEERFPDMELITQWPDKAMEYLAPDHRTAVICLAHDPKLDDPALACALRSKAFYIGALGSRKTGQARHERLTAQGFTGKELERIYGPVGLDIGAKSPAEIAVAIMAEATLALHKQES